MTLQEKLSTYLDGIAWKGGFSSHGVDHPFEQRKVFIDTVVATPAGDADLSVGDLKAIVALLEATA